MEYFGAISKRLSCTGLWWDTISVHTERQARTRALNQMHNSFRRAKHTIVHDRWLLQFPWADDGSPCVALVLSPWFTRAWTALELIMSKSMKVLYKGEDGHTPLIKDLDRDILVQKESITSRGHYVASTLLRRLRRMSDISLASICTILGTRFATYSRDRMIIANLLADCAITEQQNSQAQLTRNIITRFGYMNQSFLLHGHASLQSSGPWSWCPPSLFYGHMAGNQRSIQGDADKLSVSQDGNAWKNFVLVKLLDQEMASALVPHAYHISVAWKIHAALRHWQRCFLLQLVEAFPSSTPPLAILAQPFVIGHGEAGKPVIDCAYIGTVYASIPIGRKEYCNLLDSVLSRVQPTRLLKSFVNCSGRQ